MKKRKMMKKKKVRKILWPYIGFAIMSIGGVLVKTGLKRSWMGIRHRKPPKKEKKVTSWKDMILWTFISSVVSSFSNLFLAQTSRWAGKKLKAV
ncbi:MAG: DUF4235 domain-containing protein [Chitinispirillaceae bacterium]